MIHNCHQFISLYLDIYISTKRGLLLWISSSGCRTCFYNVCRQDDSLFLNILCITCTFAKINIQGFILSIILSPFKTVIKTGSAIGETSCSSQRIIKVEAKWEVYIYNKIIIILRRLFVCLRLRMEKGGENGKNF